MIDTQIRFRGRRVLVENDPRLSEENNRISVCRFQQMIEDEVLWPRSERLQLDLPKSFPEPEVAYDVVTLALLRKKEPT